MVDGRAATSAVRGETHRNEILVVGRLPACATERELPSGDVVLTWRLVVDRPPRQRKGPEGAKEAHVDTLDCAGWLPGVRRLAAGWELGDIVLVEGALRRRFWRSPGGVTSRYEIEVMKAKRLARA